ncbi:MAG: carboxypeptidase regulatory-like domain-containing protein, partial [Deltaproteobacteria bacterium]|nr:carboxypeptidase regulatory-like domain-containing protein [Deltaproteobacteria bacterium]
MTQRKSMMIAVAILALGALWFLRASGPETVPIAALPQEAEPAVQAGTTTWSADRELRAHRVEASEAKGQEAKERQWLTPLLERAATEADGALEVTVSGRGQPHANAEVRLYLRGERDPNTSLTEWRLAGVAKTNKDGKARLFARAGGYEVTAHAEGFAPVTQDVVRPQGEKLTKVALSLAEGSTLEGRTVVRGSGEGVPFAQVTLSPSGASGGRRRMRMMTGHADAPPDERVVVLSDNTGHFKVQGLTPGMYSAEATATGQAKAEARRVPVPGTANLVL